MEEKRVMVWGNLPMGQQASSLKWLDDGDDDTDEDEDEGDDGDDNDNDNGMIMKMMMRGGGWYNTFSPASQ